MGKWPCVGSWWRKLSYCWSVMVDVSLQRCLDVKNSVLGLANRWVGPVVRERDQRVCSDLEIVLLSLCGKTCASVLERNRRFNREQCVYFPGSEACSVLDLDSMRALLVTSIVTYMHRKSRHSPGLEGFWRVWLYSGINAICRRCPYGWIRLWRLMSTGVVCSWLDEYKQSHVWDHGSLP